MKGIIDRFENNFAILEIDNGMIDIERSLLPSDAKEGDCILLKDGVYIIDVSETEKREKRE